MKYLKYFQQNSEYQTYKESADFITPNVSYAVDSTKVFYNPGSDSSSDYVMVDLGLPSGLKWADRNVGAASPEDAGLYFQWGDTVGYTSGDLEAKGKYFGFGDYFDTTDSGSTFNKYYNDGELTVLEAVDDAATVNMGSNWRMPTNDEFKELINNTTIWMYISFNGTEYRYADIAKTDKLSGIFKGIKFIGPNGNSIFIPAAGYLENYQGSNLNGYEGDLWTSSLSSSPTINPDANALYASLYYRSAPTTRVKERRLGLNVRGVCN